MPSASLLHQRSASELLKERRRQAELLEEQPSVKQVHLGSRIPLERRIGGKGRTGAAEPEPPLLLLRLGFRLGP